MSVISRAMRQLLISFSHFSVFPVSQFIITFYIYIYAFSRRFYPKRLTLHSSYSFYILSALAFPGNRTHDLGVASAMLYQLSYRKAHHVAVNKTRCLNLQYKHLFVCAIQYLSTMYTPRFRKFLSVFTFRHIVYFSLQVFSSSDLHWNTIIYFQCSSVHVVHSYDVQEQNNFPQKQQCSL